MSDSEIENAVGSFVESLKIEQKSNKLIEDNSNREPDKEENKSGGFFKLVSILKKILEMICIGEALRIETNEKKMTISVYGDDMSIAIGKYGKTLDALEDVINLIGKRKKLIENKIFLDIKDYRKNNIERIKELAIQMAEKAIKEKRKISLKPMSSYERKIVHSALSDVKDVKTVSKYEEPNRQIVIYPLTEKSG